MDKDTDIFEHESVQRTIVVVDLVRYSEIAKSLQEGQKLGASATLLLNKQIQDLIRQALKFCGATPACLIKSTGDGAILQFEHPTLAEFFAITLHQLSFERHSEPASNPFEWRSFRIGIFTGEVVLTSDEIAGAVVGFAARLEAAAGAGEIVIDSNSLAQLTRKQQASYGPKEELQIKPHDPVFAVHRRQVVPAPQWDEERESESEKSKPSTESTFKFFKTIKASFESVTPTKRRWIAVGAILLLAGAVIAMVVKRDLNSRTALEKARLHSEQGDALIEKNQFVEAEAEYRKALSFAPNNARYNFKLVNAISLVRRHSTEVETEAARGETLARESIRLEPNNPAHYHALGRALSDQGKYAEAEVSFREATKLSPNDAEYHHDLGFLSLFLQDKFNEAESEIRQAIKLKSYFDYYASLARILEANQNYIEAELQARKAIELNPVPYWLYERLGDILFEQQKCQQALAAYKEALDRNPKSAYSENGIGNVYFTQGRNAEAEAKYNRAIQLDATWPVLHSNLGNLLSRLGRGDEAKSKKEAAETAHRELIKRFPKDAGLHIDFGDFLNSEKRYDEARAEYEAAISLAPEQPKYHVILGYFFESQNKHDEAKSEYDKGESIYRKLAEQHQTEAGYHFDLGMAQYTLRQEDEARLQFEKAAALSSDNPYYYTVVGRFSYDRKEYADSKISYQKAVRLQPENPEYRSFLGNVWYAMEQYEYAKLEFKRAHDESPEEPLYIHGLGACFFKLGQYSEAEEAYRKAVQLNPNNGGYHNDLATALYRQQLYAKALPENRKAVELSPTNALFLTNLADTLYQLGNDEEVRRLDKKAKSLKNYSSDAECR